MGRESLHPSLLWICDSTGIPFGVGFLVEAKRALTNAHVIAQALRLSAIESEAPAEDVWVRFIHLDAALCKARVVPGQWFPPLDSAGLSNAGDLALLELIDAVPSGARPAPLLTNGSESGSRIAAFGLPKGHNIHQGGWASGVLAGEQASGWVQFDNDSTGYAVQQGFSGSPAWSDELEGVVGVVVAADNLGNRVSWIIPNRFIADCYPDLEFLPGKQVARDRISYATADRVSYADRSVPGTERLDRMLQNVLKQIPGFRGDVTLASDQRRTLISTVRALWIAGQRPATTDLGLKLSIELHDRPDALVPLPFGAVLPPVDANTDTLDAVFRANQRRMLILGGAGSGKTTSALEILSTELEAAESDENEPVPVMFPLASWSRSRQDLDSWFVYMLSQPYNLPRALAETLVRTQSIYPLLDGLDEVSLEFRHDCLRAINEYQAAHPDQPLLVCCRTDDYLQLDTRLKLWRAVELTPLSRPRILAALEALGPRWDPVASALRHDNPDLEALLSSPLLLDVAARSYADQPPLELARLGTAPTELGSAPVDLSTLWSRYVSTMHLRRRDSDPSGSDDLTYEEADSVRWLAWLASFMEQNRMTEFHPHLLQLSRPLDVAVRLCSGVVAFGLFYSLIISGNSVLSASALGLTLGHHTILNGGLASFGEDLSISNSAAILLSAGIGGLTTLVSGSRPAQRIQLSPSSARRAARPAAAVAVIFLLLSALSVSVSFGLKAGLVLGGLCFSVFGTVAFGVAVLSTSGTATAVGVFDARRLLRRSAIRAMCVWVFTATSVALGGWTIMRTAAALDVVGENSGFDFTAGELRGSLIIVTPLFCILWIRWLWWRSTGSLPWTFGVVAIAAALQLTHATSGGLEYVFSRSFADWAWTGVATGLIAAWGAGFAFVIRYLLIRVLGVRSRVMPWRYVDYLGWASDALLLRRAGGGFQFFHGALRSFFARTPGLRSIRNDPNVQAQSSHGD